MSELKQASIDYANSVDYLDCGQMQRLRIAAGYLKGSEETLDTFVAELEKVAISPIGGLGVGDEVKTIKLLYLEQVYETAKRIKGEV